MTVQLKLGELYKEAEEENKAKAGGAIDFTAQTTGRLSKIPGMELRPGAPKMQLRPHEEARLGLVCCTAPSA